MILQSEVKTKVKTNITAGPQQFRISHNSKTFKILSDNLYSRKVEAIVRELSCNAYDAHVAKGIVEKPFDVHLPTIMEPYFEIEDYGPGLSEEELQTLYTTYFSSSKDASNDYVGALGLGSKSPFCYTDTFSGISIHDNKLINFVCYINDKDFPEYRVVSVEENTSDKESGLKIIVPVEEDDFDKFVRAADRVYWGFEVNPNGVEDAITSPKIREYKMDEDIGYFLNEAGLISYSFRDNRFSISDCFSAQQGNVIYPIDLSIVLEELKDHESIVIFYQALIDHGLNFIAKFDIGSLDIQPSREELSYNTHTVKILKKEFIRIYKSVLSGIKKCIKTKRDKNRIESINWVNNLKLLEYLDETFPMYKAFYECLEPYMSFSCSRNRMHLYMNMEDEEFVKEFKSIEKGFFVNMVGGSSSIKKQRIIVNNMLVPKTSPFLRKSNPLSSVFIYVEDYSLLEDKYKHIKQNIQSDYSTYTTFMSDYFITNNLDLLKKLGVDYVDGEKILKKNNFLELRKKNRVLTQKLSISVIPLFKSSKYTSSYLNETVSEICDKLKNKKVFYVIRHGMSYRLFSISGLDHSFKTYERLKDTIRSMYDNGILKKNTCVIGGNRSTIKKIYSYAKKHNLLDIQPLKNVVPEVEKYLIRKKDRIESLSQTSSYLSYSDREYLMQLASILLDEDIKTEPFIFKNLYRNFSKKDILSMPRTYSSDKKDYLSFIDELIFTFSLPSIAKENQYGWSEFVFDVKTIFPLYHSYYKEDSLHYIQTKEKRLIEAKDENYKNLLEKLIVLLKGIDSSYEDVLQLPY